MPRGGNRNKGKEKVLKEKMPLKKCLLGGINDEFIFQLKLSENLTTQKKLILRDRVRDQGLLLDLITIGDLEGVQVLIEKLKIDPNIIKGLLLDLITIGDLEGVQVLIEKLKIDPNIINCTFTPLMVAAEFGQLDIFKYLIEKGSNVNLKSQTRMTALFYAIYNNRQEIVDFMVAERKAKRLHFEINLLNVDFYSPLILACKLGHYQIVNRLLELEDINLELLDKHQGSALILCANNTQKGKLDHIRIARALVKRGANIYHQNSKGVDALLLFAFKGALFGLKLLIDAHLEKNKDNPKNALQTWVNRSDKLGRRALHAVGAGGDFDCLRFLVGCGADINAQTNKGTSVLFEAAANTQYELIEKSLEGITGICPITREPIQAIPNLQLADKNGNTLLIYLLGKAITLKAQMDIKKLEGALKLIKRIIGLTENFDSQVFTLKSNGEQYTPLAFAITLKDKKIIQALLTKGSNIGFLITERSSIFKRCYRLKFRDIAFPLLLKHKFTQLCQDLNNANTAIDLLCDYLLGNQKFNHENSPGNNGDLRGDTNGRTNVNNDPIAGNKELVALTILKGDNLLLKLKSGNIIMTAEDVPPLVSKISQQLDTNPSLSPKEITSLLLETLQDAKRKIEQRNLDNQLAAFNNPIKAFYDVILDVQFISELIFSFDDTLDFTDIGFETIDKNEIAERKQFMDALQQARIEIQKIVLLEQQFQALVEKDKENYIKHIENSDVKARTEIVDRLGKTVSDLKNARDMLQKINQTISGHQLQKNRNQEKEKTKGITAQEIIQQKIMEFEKRSQQNPDLQIATTIKSAAQKGSDQSDPNDSHSKECVQISINKSSNLETKRLWEQLDMLTKIGQRPFDQLKVFESDKITTKTLNANALQGIHQDLEILDVEEDEYEDAEMSDFLTQLQVLDHMDDREQKHKAENPSHLLNSHFSLEVTKVADPLALLTVVMNSKLEHFHLLPEKDFNFMMDSAIFGGFVLLLEELKKFKDRKLFSPSLARILRNFIFHEEGALSNFTLEVSELKILCQKVLDYLLANINDIKNGNKTLKTIEHLLKKIDSKLFTDLVKMAMEKASLVHILPTSEICLAQISQAETELDHFKLICKNNPHLMEDTKFCTLLRVGLIRTCARLGSYVSFMKQHYFEKFRKLKLDRYQSFIRLGILFRHGREAFVDQKESSDAQENETSQENIMVLADDLIAEILLDLLPVPETTHANLSQSSYLPRYQAGLNAVNVSADLNSTVKPDDKLKVAFSGNDKGDSKGDKKTNANYM